MMEENPIPMYIAGIWRWNGVPRRIAFGVLMDPVFSERIRMPIAGRPGESLASGGGKG
jgi:hypothetical protein